MVIILFVGCPHRSLFCADGGTDDLHEKGNAVRYNKNVYHALMMISQFGINMLVPIFICSFAGMFLDRKFGTSYWTVALFFVGALAGFTNVFRFAKKIYETPAQTRRRGTKKQSDERKKSAYEEEN